MVAQVVVRQRLAKGEVADGRLAAGIDDGLRVHGSPRCIDDDELAVDQFERHGEGPR